MKSPGHFFLLITSTWFLTQKIPQTNARDLDLAYSVVFSEQVHRLRILEQASFCLQDRLIVNDTQAKICSNVLPTFNLNYSEKRNQVLRDAKIMQSRNIDN